MELLCDLGVYFEEEPIQRLDSATLRRMHPRKNGDVQKAIDRMGTLSTQAQGLKRVLTTFEKLVDSEEGQVLYLMWRKHPQAESRSLIIGMLKIGYKTLYLVDGKMRTYKTSPLCVLDFFIHETLQRQGNGHALFDHMLQHEKCRVEDVAIDKPSDSLVQFIAKHYQLVDPVWQSTNYVVYPPFFEHLSECDELENSRKMQTSSKTEAFNNDEHERVTHSRERDTVSELMRGNLTDVRRISAAPDTPQGRKNERDFGHQSIW